MYTSSASQGIKQVHSTDHAGEVLDHLRAHFESQQLFDAILIAGVDKKRVSAHRLVLSACSPYFSAMFTGSLREATEKEVTLNEVQGDILQALVAFCYSGRIELRQDTAEMLLVTASLLQLNTVVTECENYLAEQLDPSNCLGMLSLADRHHCKDLRKKALEYTHEEFMEVCKNEEFFSLSATQLAELIASDDLNVTSEEEVFNIVMQWVNSDFAKRKLYLRQLLPKVRMTQLLPSFIENHVETVCRSSDCLHLFKNANNWHSCPDKRQEMATEYTKPRPSTLGTLLAIGGFYDSTDDLEQIQIESYCPSSDKWTVLNTAISYRDNFSVATMDDNLLIVGGDYTCQLLNSGINMNFNTLMLTELQPMNTLRSHLCVAVVENTLYAIGGSDDDSNTLNTVERFDSVERTWNYVAPMSTNRLCAGAAVLNGCIYVVGGEDKSTYRTVECYNPRSNTWTERAPMSVPRHSLGVAVSKGFLYAVGGDLPGYEGNTSTAERYDSVIDKWTMIESTSVSRAYLGCSFLGKCLMAVGGLESSMVEEYDPETNKWTKKGSLTHNYETVAVCVVPKRYISKLSHQLK